ncbi:MAG TPA: tRNA (adenosine(37)-N6)-dimethylallyltransferase MiaA [Verrucomicrobiota bacterium]|nr:tRNA (adenosine(37)-N6)-dimethylallyltransferase MiaA [Verrucomicrobiota bacterium]
MANAPESHPPSSIPHSRRERERLLSPSLSSIPNGGEGGRRPGEGALGEQGVHSAKRRPDDSLPIFVAGPTAVGKSDVALLLAEQIGGEIISVDSMQVYRGLDIGTAKPSPAERARVPHHLIDVVDLNESFDAAKFVELARKAVSEIQSRGRVPIFCGGTGLYFKAFLDGLGDAPPSDEKLRAELESTPLDDLLRELEHRDPATFAKIDRDNPRRVIRAMEVIRITGRPFLEQRADWVHATRNTQHAARLFALTRTSEDLHARINARVDKMFAAGLVDETRLLLEHGLAQNKTAMQAIGYRQVVEHLRGERDLPATIELVKSRTRQFAKRQMTWFKRQLSPEWIELKSSDRLADIARSLTAT